MEKIIKRYMEIVYGNCILERPINVIKIYIPIQIIIKIQFPGFGRVSNLITYDYYYLRDKRISSPPIIHMSPYNQQQITPISEYKATCFQMLALI